MRRKQEQKKTGFIILCNAVYDPPYLPDDLEETVSKFCSSVFHDSEEVCCLTPRVLGNKECLKKMD